MVGWANDGFDSRTNHEVTLSSHKVKHLVIEFDDKHLATVWVLNCVLIAGAQAVDFVYDSELSEEI